MSEPEIILEHSNNCELLTNRMPLFIWPFERKQFVVTVEKAQIQLITFASHLIKLMIMVRSSHSHLYL